MRVKDSPQVGKSKGKVLDCKEELKALINKIPWEAGKRNSEMLTPREIIYKQNSRICQSLGWVGKVRRKQFSKP